MLYKWQILIMHHVQKHKLSLSGSLYKVMTPVYCSIVTITRSESHKASFFMW